MWHECSVELEWQDGFIRLKYGRGKIRGWFSLSPQKKKKFCTDQDSKRVPPCRIPTICHRSISLWLGCSQYCRLLLLIDFRFISTVTRMARSRLTSMSMRSKSGINMSQSVASILKSNPVDIWSVSV
jgi:hypothetical protein